MSTIHNNNIPIRTYPQRLPFLPSDAMSLVMSYLNPKETANAARAHSYFRAEKGEGLRWQFLSRREFSSTDLKCYCAAMGLKNISDLFPMMEQNRAISLTFCDAEISDEAFQEMLKRSPPVLEIRLIGCGKLTDASIEYLAEKNPHLKSIWIEDCICLSDATLFFRLFPEIRSLGFSGRHSFADVPLDLALNCRFLTKFVMGNEAIVVAAANNIMRGCPSLEEVHMYNGINFGTINQVIPNLKKIKFDIEGHHSYSFFLENYKFFLEYEFDEESLDGNRFIIHCQELIKLFPNIIIENKEIFSAAPVKDEVLVALVKHFPNLEIIDLPAKDTISTEALQQIAQCSPHLTKIKLSDSFHMSDAYLLRLAKYCPKYKNNKFLFEFASKETTRLGLLHRCLFSNADSSYSRLRCYRTVIQKHFHALSPLQQLKVYNAIFPDRPLTLITFNLKNILEKVTADLTKLSDAIYPFLSIATINELITKFQTDEWKKLLIEQNYVVLSQDMLSDVYEKGAQITSLAFSRFIEVHENDLIGIFPRLVHLHSIDLSHAHYLTDKAVLVLANLPKLKKAIFKNCVQLTDQSIKALAKGCLNLTEIDLTGCNQITQKSIIALVDNCRRLQTLKSSIWQSCTAEAAIALAFSSCIIDLMYDDYQVFGKLLRRFQNEMRMQPKTVLGEYYLDLLRKRDVKSIEKLELHFLGPKFPLTEADYELMSENFVAFCEKATLFFQSGKYPPLPKDMGITIHVRKKPALQQAISLTPLDENTLDDLSDNPQISPEEIIARIKEKPDLKKITLSGCINVNDQVVEAIIQFCPKVTDIDFEDCYSISNEAIIKLAKSLVLQQINLKNCVLITGKGIDDLNIYCTGIKIIK